MNLFIDRGALRHSIGHDLHPMTGKYDNVSDKLSSTRRPPRRSPATHLRVVGRRGQLTSCAYVFLVLWTVKHRISSCTTAGRQPENVVIHSLLTMSPMKCL